MITAAIALHGSSREHDRMTEWYYLDESKLRKGPVTQSELVALIERGLLHAHSRVWRGGLRGWVTLEETQAELGDVRLAEAPPPLPEPEPEKPVEAVRTDPLELASPSQTQDVVEDPNEWISDAAPAPPATRHYYHAGLIKRFAAYVLDQLIMFVVLLPVLGIVGMFTLAETTQPTDLVFGPMQLIQFAATWLYYAYCESSTLRGTIGKRALGLYVTRPHGAPLTFARASLRFFAKIPAAMLFMVGILMIAFHPQKQGLHDQMADAYVVADSAEKLEIRPFEWALVAFGALLLFLAVNAMGGGAA